MHGATCGEQTLDRTEVRLRVCAWCNALVRWRNGRWAHHLVKDARCCGRPPVPVARGRD